MSAPASPMLISLLTSYFSINIDVAKELATLPILDSINIIWLFW
ncbi:hypothetical protein MNB_SUP05-10-541 [hydrothermal vent metagenome]|uniref:Uncharacterized protein n=1 Tax=hydrothermal vent metagenome TaxID=652676 RepID=A0A1W1DAV0_9ZZZZ